MEVIDNSDPFDWLRPLQADRRVVVASDVPEGFEAYCVIYHPLFAVPAEAIVQPDTASMPAALRDLVEESVAISAPFDESRAERISWRSLCERLGVAFESGFTPQAFGRHWPEGYITDEGAPGIDFVRAVGSHLIPRTGDQECWFWYMCPPAHFGMGIDEMYRGPLNQLPELLESFAPHTYSPTYWWPEDRSWVVHSDYDSSFTTVAATEEVIAGLESDAGLEVLRVNATTEWMIRPTGTSA